MVIFNWIPFKIKFLAELWSWYGKLSTLTLDLHVFRLTPTHSQVAYFFTSSDWESAITEFFLAKSVFFFCVHFHICSHFYMRQVITMNPIISRRFSCMSHSFFIHVLFLGVRFGYLCNCRECMFCRMCSGVKGPF